MEQEEKKPVEGEEVKPEGEQPANNEPNQNPDETSRKIAELEEALKDSSTKISDLSTTIATMNQREREISKASEDDNDVELEERAEKILENAQYDPKTAAKELTKFIKDSSRKNVNPDAVIAKAKQAMQNEAKLDKLRMGIKLSNPNFDDDVVKTIMERAGMIADEMYRRNDTSKTAEQIVKQATDFVKAKFDNYAKSMNAAPPLPEGARAENGGNTPPAPVKKEEVPTPESEISERQKTLQNKVF